MPKKDTLSPVNAGIGNAMTGYLKSFFEEHPEILSMNNLYPLIMQEVEKPLLMCVLDFTKGNQSLAAEILGLNRNTLRKKIIELKLVIKDFR